LSQVFGAALLGGCFTVGMNKNERLGKSLLGQIREMQLNPE